MNDISKVQLRYPEGIHFQMPHDIYHADPAPEPSLSCGCGQTLLDTNPARARFGHPRLNPGCDPWQPTTAMDEGSALHKLVMGDGPDIKIIPADDWRTKAAKEVRADARAVGAIPLLTERFHELQAMAWSLRNQLANHPEASEVLSEDYSSEVSMIWRERTGAMCRARPDRMHRTDPHAPIYDWKFTDRLQPPHAWDKTALASNWDMRAAFYARGAAALRGGILPTYRFIVAEKEPPYDLMVLQLTPEFIALGMQKAETAIRAWEACMKANAWPGYPARLFHIAPPGWAESKWIERPDIDNFLPVAAE